ncbi:MAG: tetratricopeptide repeat protein [Gammaproteobacteria bacterium]|nr:tetratricopeptide repeat protein [Gammaproteobacteria bacterium]
MRVRHKNYWHILPIAALLAASQTAPGEESKTVLGPRNINLYDGANALMAGDAEEGVRLTLLGLQMAKGSREEKIGHANLCAGYLMIDQPDTALVHCNWVLERDDAHWRTYNNRALVYLRLERFDESEEDIRKGQALKPGSTKLKIVKGMYLDETQPVTPKVEIDERRNPTEEPSDEPSGDVDD